MTISSLACSRPLVAIPSAELLVISAFLLPPLLFGDVHPGFRIDAQSLGNPRNVVEVPDDLRSNRNLIVRPTVFAQSLDVGFPHLAGGEREFHGIVT